MLKLTLTVFRTANDDYALSWIAGGLIEGGGLIARSKCLPKMQRRMRREAKQAERACRDYGADLRLKMIDLDEGCAGEPEGSTDRLMF